MEAAGCVVAAVIENAAPGPQGHPGSGDVLEGDMLSSSDVDKDPALPQHTDNSSPERKQPQETNTAMARSDDITEHPAEPLLRSCVSTASMKVKNMKKMTFPKGHFPRLEECAHFHYETVDFGNVQLAFAEGHSEGQAGGLDSKEPVFLIQISCQGRNWLVKRCYEDFRVLDKHLHLCIYDRRYSHLTELPRYDVLKDTVESVTKMLSTYLSRFSAIADNKINCGPVLTWMELDNKGNHLLVSEEASINVPAIAAAHVTKRYTAQATDELTFEVGDIVSVIDMPPKEDTGWWRGKHGFQVGFFPCDCVELINDKIPPSVQSAVPKPVCKKHGKLVTFLRSFMKSRPPPQKLRQRGILRERVFGCDLGEHLHNSGHEVPQVVKSCAEFIEKHGVVDGIYRLSGISSNIQKLRHEFDSEQIPDLSRDVFRQDIHSVGSLCKLYFRELPNPLLTYQLYERFSEAVSAATDEERLVKIHNVIQQLPPPHYRTLEFLMRHLSRLATFSPITSMHTKNLAIVWAPNLLRSRQIESACFSGTAAFMEVRIQSVVVEFILNNTEALFSQKLNAVIRESTGNSNVSRPKSLLICSPSTKLLSLEEAQARTQAQLSSPATTPCLTHSDYIEVGEGPGALLGKFHTVIDIPMDSTKRPPTKAKKSPVGNWLSFFHLGKSHSLSKRKLKRHPSEPNEIKSIALPGGRGDSGTLRSTKSEESLTSLHNLEGEPPAYRPLRPRSTSEAISPVTNDDLRFARIKDGSKIHHPLNESLRGISIGRHQEDELDLCPPAAGIGTLDFDPMSFQFSPTADTPGLKRDSKLRKSAGCSSESEPISSPNNNNNISCSPSPEDFSPVLNKPEKKSSSPKLGKKSFKTQVDIETPSPLSPEEKRDFPKEPRVSYQHCSPLSTASHTSGLTDLNQSAQNLPDPGTDRLMSSVCVLPPHPPSMSAARKLALALAETAHKASSGSQRRTNLQPHPFQRQDTYHGQDRPLRPSVLDLKVYPEDYGAPRVSQWQTSAHGPMESLFCPHPVHYPPVQIADPLESNFTPNVSPLGSGSFDDGTVDRRDHRQGNDPTKPTYQSIGVSTPTQHVCSTQSPSSSPVYVNTDSTDDVFNFRAVLAETSMPASVNEVLPRTLQPFLAQSYSPDEERPLGVIEDVYGQHHLHHHQSILEAHIPAPHCPRPSALPHHLSGPKSVFCQSSEGQFSSLGLRQPMSPQYRRYPREEHLISSCHGQQDQWQRPKDRMVGHPAIRRARSFHSPQISHFELAQAEVLPPDAMFFIEQKASKKAPYQRLIQTGIHPVRLQFESVGADPHYFSDMNPLDSAHAYAEPSWQRGKLRSQSYIVRSTRESRQSDYCNFSPRHFHPLNRELFPESKDRADYKPQDVEAAFQPAKHVSKSRHKSTRPVESPYENAVSPTDTRTRDIMHIRSKSDPGNASLLNVDRTESQNAAIATSPTSPRSLQSNIEDTRQLVGQLSSAKSMPLRRIQIKEGFLPQPPLRKVPSLPERDGPKLKNTGNKDRSHTRGHEQGEIYMANVVHSYSGVVKPSILRRPGRSQSTRENRHYYHQHAKSPLEPEHPASFSSQLTRRTQSTKVRPTQYEHMKEYHAAPKPKSTRSGKATVGCLPGQSCVSPHGHKLLSMVLGQEGFCPRSEAGVYEGF